MLRWHDIEILNFWGVTKSFVNLLKILTISQKNVHVQHFVCLHFPYGIAGRLQLVLCAEHRPGHWYLEATQQLSENSIVLFCSFYKRKPHPLPSML